MNAIEITHPDDWHCHLRDGSHLATTVPYAAMQFKRAIVMPNLKPAVTNVLQAQDYYQRILAARPKGSDFSPLMTLYLTDETTPETIIAAKQSGIIFGCKLYPAGVTTHSQQGVTQLENIYPALAAMAEHQLPLLIHGEVNDPLVDIFDREQVFIDRHLNVLVKNFPHLKIVLEHITTREAVDFVKNSPANVAATITPQHLLFNRNILLAGGLRPHYYCLPILKRQEHQDALINAATSGNPKFFLGTDSAPHAKSQKESSCGCAGIFNHVNALEIYAFIFEQAQKLDKLEGFASHFGADFYQLPRNKEKIQLVKQDCVIPDTIAYEHDTLIPFLAGQTIPWQRRSP